MEYLQVPSDLRLAVHEAGGFSEDLQHCHCYHLLVYPHHAAAGAAAAVEQLEEVLPPSKKVADLQKGPADERSADAFAV